MRTSVRNKKLASFGIASLVLVLAFQNCAKGGFNLEEPFVGMTEDDAIAKIQQADLDSRDNTTMPVAQYTCTAHLDQMPHQDIPLRPTETMAKCFQQCEIISTVLDIQGGGLSCSAQPIVDGPIIIDPPPVDPPAEKPRLIVVGTYESNKDHSKRGDVHVHIKGSGVPFVLVLTHYESTNWNVTADNIQDLRKVVVFGYEGGNVQVEGRNDTPIETNFYDVSGSTSLDHYAYSFTLKDSAYEKEMAAKDISSSSGCMRLLQYDPVKAQWDGTDAYSKCSQYFHNREYIQQIERTVGLEVSQMIGDYTAKKEYVLSEIPPVY